MLLARFAADDVILLRKPGGADLRVGKNHPHYAKIANTLARHLKEHNLLESEGLIPLRGQPQPDDFTCWDMIAMAIGKLHGVGPGTLEEWKKALDTDRAHATFPDRFAAYLQSLGLKITTKHDMTVEELREHWRRGEIVVCPIQEYGRETKAQPYGHAVAVVDFPSDGVLMVFDPSIDNALAGQHTIQASGLMPIDVAVWDASWWEDHNGIEYDHYGIVVGAKDDVLESWDESKVHRGQPENAGEFASVGGGGKKDGSQTQARTQQSGRGSESPSKARGSGLQDTGGLRGGSERLEPSSAAAPVSGEALAGAPTSAKVPGLGVVPVGPDLRVRQCAADYMKSAHLNYDPPKTYVKVDRERAKRIADAYTAMANDPNDPKVKAAYLAMSREVVGQYEACLKAGLKVEFIDFAKTGDPYAASPRLAIEDVKTNNHMWVFPTASGFGSDASFDASKNPLLADSGHKISGQPACINDLFRVVHDYFGHCKDGVGMRADGEENAWRSHSAMFSPLARAAMTSETRGQNSWVNFGPHGEANRKASGASTVYADQKVGLLPDWCITEGTEADDRRIAQAKADYAEHGVHAKAFKEWFGDWDRSPADASKVVDPSTGEPKETHPIPGAGSKVMQDGVPVVVYHGTAHGGFQSFDKSKAEGTSLYGPGFYFTEDQGVADSYQTKGLRAPEHDLNPTSQETKAVYLNIRKPFDKDRDRVSIEALREHLPKQFAEQGAFLGKEPLDYDSLVGFLSQKTKGPRDLNFTYGQEGATLLLQKMGHDGITHTGGDIMGGGHHHRVWIAFEPNQIKSVNNRGTFDAHSDRLLEADFDASQDLSDMIVRRLWDRMAAHPDDHAAVKRLAQEMTRRIDLSHLSESAASDDLSDLIVRRLWDRLAKDPDDHKALKRLAAEVTRRTDLGHLDLKESLDTLEAYFVPTVAEINAAAREADKNPSHARREAGIYKKGRIRIHGLLVTIENAKGSFRRGISANGKPWEMKLSHPYGYITQISGESVGKGAGDDEHHDCYLGPHPKSEVVFVIDQNKPDGSHDESKCMIGWTNAYDAKEAYLSNYAPGWKGFAGITAMTLANFKKWLTSKKAHKRVAVVESAENPAAGLPTKQLKSLAAKLRANEKAFQRDLAQWHRQLGKAIVERIKSNPKAPARQSAHEAVTETHRKQLLALVAKHAREAAAIAAQGQMAMHDGNSLQEGVDVQESAWDAVKGLLSGVAAKVKSLVAAIVTAFSADSVIDPIVARVEVQAKKALEKGDDVADSLNKTVFGKDKAKSFGFGLAVTLNTQGANAGAEAAGHVLFEQGVINAKRWMCLHGTGNEDQKVRPTHHEANGQTVPLAEKFTLTKEDGGTETCEGPGDFVLSAGNRKNCRCLKVYVYDPKYDPWRESPVQESLVLYESSERNLFEDKTLFGQGFTGVITDAIGRKMTFVDGKHVKGTGTAEDPEQVSHARVNNQKVHVVAYDPDLDVVKVQNGEGKEWTVSSKELNHGAPGSKEEDAEAERYMDERMPMLDALIAKGEKDRETVSTAGGDWDSLDDSTKDDVESKWMDANISSYYDSEVQSWEEGLHDIVQENQDEDDAWHDLEFDTWAREQGFTPESARAAVQDQYRKLNESDVTWKELQNPDASPNIPDIQKAVLDYVNSATFKNDDGATEPALATTIATQEVIEALKRGLPPAITDDTVDADQIVKDALASIARAQSRTRVVGGHNRNKMNIDFDKLRFKDGSSGKEEDDWEGEWESDYKKAKEEDIEERLKTEQENPPESLGQQAHDAMDDVWGQMDDSDKLKFMQSEGIDGSGGDITVQQPQKWKVFKDGRDYEKTRSVALFVQLKRADALIKERLAQNPDWKGLGVDVEKLSAEVWSDWKSSSTTTTGLALQDATAAELNGLLLMNLDSHLRAEEAYVKIAMDASGRKPNIGRAGAIKLGKTILQAYARATWEASQYVLRKADIKELTTWRGLMLDGDMIEREGKAEPVTFVPKHAKDAADSAVRTKLPGLHLDKNGAASATTDSGTANTWDGVGPIPPNAKRVVLRIQSPRTAVLSAPCFGQNLENEQETVLAGTHWTAWDAWLDRAPTEDQEEVFTAEAVSESAESEKEPDEQPGHIDLFQIDCETGKNWLSQIREEGKAKRKREARQKRIALMVAKRNSAKTVQEAAEAPAAPAKPAAPPKVAFTGIDSHGHKWISGKQTKINQDEPAAKKTPTAKLNGQEVSVIARDSKHGLVRVKGQGGDKVVRADQLDFGDQIPGGKADNRLDSEFDPEALKAGMKVEAEHTKDEELAKEIAKDHLSEFPDYYVRLAKMEAEAKRDKAQANPQTTAEAGLGDSVSVGESLAKFSHYLHEKGAAGFAKLPSVVQTVVGKTLSIMFTAWTKAQDLAEEVALERGASPDQAMKMRSSFAAWDIAFFKPLAVAAHAGGPLAELATWVVPPVTGSYLALSAVTHPMATYRAAKNLVSDAKEDAAKFAKGVGKFVDDHTANLKESAESMSSAQQAIAEALERHHYDDWYAALLHAAIEETRDVGEAIKLADAAFAKQSKDTSTPKDDDADALFNPQRNKPQGDEADFSEDDITLLEKLIDKRTSDKRAAGGKTKSVQESAAAPVHPGVQGHFTGIITDKLGRKRKFVDGDPVKMDEDAPQMKAPVARFKGQKIHVIAQDSQKGLLRIKSASGEAVVRADEIDFREPSAEPKKYGKSKAETSVRSSDEEIKPYLDKLFPGLDREAAAQAMADCVGAPDDAKVFIFVATDFDGRDVINVNVKHPDLKACSRIFDIDERGQKFIHNDLLLMRKPGGGLGPALLAKQVENAAENGFAYISTTAGGSGRNLDENGRYKPDTMNGYYTWPLAGYNADLWMLNTQLAVKKQFPEAKTIRDVILSPGGREWWKKWGDQIDDMKFDLSEGSMSREMLAEYIDEHDKKRAARQEKPPMAWTELPTAQLAPPE